LQGAQCRNNQLLLTSSIMMELPITLLRWIRVSGDEKVATSKLSLPIYLNSTRTELLYTVDLNIAPGQDPHSFYERGVALLTSTSLN
jgi:dynein heavy chain 1